MDDVGSGAVQYLRGFSDVTALVGSFPTSDPVVANAGQPWIFNVGVATNTLVRMEGTGQASLALASAGSFQAGTPGSSAQYERLSVEFWVDVARDAAYNAAESLGATLRRAQGLYYTVDSHLHRREPGDNVVWGDLVTVGCVRLAAPQFYPVPDGDGLLRGQAFYGVTASGHTDQLV